MQQPADNANQADLEFMQTLDIAVQPASSENGLNLLYAAPTCDGESTSAVNICVREVETRHERGTNIRFVDATSVTLSGRVEFRTADGSDATDSDCFVPGIRVRAIDINNNEELTHGITADDGSFSLVVPRGRAVNLRFARDQV